MAERKQNDTNSSDEEDKNESYNAQRKVTEVLEEEQPSEDYGYSLERESPSDQNHAAQREEEEREDSNTAQQNTDQECGGREPICGLATRLPYHGCTTFEDQSDRYDQSASGQRSDNLVTNSEGARAHPKSVLQPGCTLRGNKIEKCTQPSNIHWPIVVPPSRSWPPELLQYRFTDKGFPVQLCTEPN